MLSSFVIILLVTALLTTVLKNKYVQAALCGMKPCIIGIVLATGCFMVINNYFNIKSAGGETDIVAIVLTAALSLAFFISKKSDEKRNFSDSAYCCFSRLRNNRLRGLAYRKIPVCRDEYQKLYVQQKIRDNLIKPNINRAATVRSRL